MRQRLIKPWPDTVKEMVTELLKKPEASQATLGAVICMTCGKPWILYKTEDSQFTRVHSCQKGVRYNVRVSVERVGHTQDERHELSHAYRSELK